MKQVVQLTQLKHKYFLFLGFLCGLFFVGWIGFGGPKPPPIRLPVSTDNCTEAVLLDVSEASATTDEVTLSDQYFYLYRISYAWTSAIGFLVTILIGIVISEIVRFVSSSQMEVEDSLLATCLRRKNRSNNAEIRLQFRNVEGK